MSIRLMDLQWNGDQVHTSVLSDNFKWNRDEGELVRCGKTRGKLVVCEEALDVLRSIDGPICPVTVTGPARTGKSYLASQLIEPRPFDCAFKTSNQMQPETMGIWMSTDVFKKTLGNGEEVTVVVLDTEGLGAYDANSQDDVHLFTLICLLSSVLVYNCRGTMTGEDLMKLSLVGALDKVIRGDEVGYSDKPKAKDFRKFFPNFLWVIRDVTLACTLRRGGKLVEVGMNEYMLKSYEELR
ncbi:guanylate-binding protein 4-like [Ptychodera flava]|uniref:guanylate-binding protein 4-like n=1 Tax=Ptychodera flava TaxID=63121 RepID=UPI00396A5839